MKFAETIQGYLAEEEVYQVEHDRITNLIRTKERQIKKLEKKLSKVNYPNWIDALLNPIARAMLVYLPGYKFRMCGPFGLTAETSILFTPLDAEMSDKFSNFPKDLSVIRKITFRPGDLSGNSKPMLSIVDYSPNTGQFKKGTLGEINNMNYPAVDVPENADGQWFISLMEGQEKISKGETNGGI